MLWTRFRRCSPVIKWCQAQATIIFLIGWQSLAMIVPIICHKISVWLWSVGQIYWIKWHIFSIFLMRWLSNHIATICDDGNVHYHHGTSNLDFDRLWASRCIFEPLLVQNSNVFGTIHHPFAYVKASNTARWHPPPNHDARCLFDGRQNALWIEFFSWSSLCNCCFQHGFEL